MAKRQLTFTLKKSVYKKRKTKDMRNWYVFKSGKKHKRVAGLREGIDYIRNKAVSLLKTGKVKKVIYKRYTSDDKLKYVRELTFEDGKINMRKIKG